MQFAIALIKHFRYFRNCLSSDKALPGIMAFIWSTKALHCIMIVALALIKHFDLV
jgi:hypothetical protein